jgi:arginase
MKIFLLSVPYDSGHHNKRLGCGPPILEQELERMLKASGQVVRKTEMLVESGFSTEITTAFEINRKLSEYVREAKEKNEFPIILSGNCNTAIGTLSGLRDDSGVIWLDCHGDYNTPETTIGGYLDGMALAMLTGACWTQLTASVRGFKPVPEAKIILIGGRDLDPFEKKRLDESNVTLIPADELLQEKTIETAEGFPSMNSIYLHIDLDVLDPAFVRINSYSTPGGLLPKELYKTIFTIKKNYTISAVAFTSYDPSYDPDRKVKTVVNEVVNIIIGNQIE